MTQLESFVAALPPEVVEKVGAAIRQLRYDEFLESDEIAPAAILAFLQASLDAKLAIIGYKHVTYQSAEDVSSLSSLDRDFPVLILRLHPPRPAYRSAGSSKAVCGSVCRFGPPARSGARLDRRKRL